MEQLAVTSLVVAVVQREDAGALIDEVNRRGYRATRIDASGGFLAVGNVAILIGAMAEQVGEVLDAIRERCHTRQALYFPISGDLMADSAVGPVEVEVGGAVVFVLPVERYVHLGELAGMASN